MHFEICTIALCFMIKVFILLIGKQQLSSYHIPMDSSTIILSVTTSLKSMRAPSVFFFSNLSIFSGTFKKEKDHFFHFFRSVIHLLKENLISNRFDSFSACKSDSQICCPFRHLLRATGVFVEHGGMTVVADSLVRKINVSKNITLPLNKPVSTAFKSSTNSAFTSTTSSW